MVIPREITAEQYDEATPEDKAMYEPGEEGKYTFVGQNAGELKRAKERVSSEKNIMSQELAALKSKVRDYETSREEAEHKKAVAKADSEAVNKKWQQKYDRDLKEQKQLLERLQTTVRQQHRQTAIENEVSQVALPQYKEIVKMLYDKRVDVELDSDNIPTIVVRDEEGKNSLDTIKDLTESFKKDKRYAEILKGESVGSGAVKQVKPDEKRPPVGDPVGQSSTGQMNVPQNLPPYGEMAGLQGQNSFSNSDMDFAKFNQFLRVPAEQIKNYTGEPEVENEEENVFKVY